MALAPTLSARVLLPVLTPEASSSLPAIVRFQLTSSSARSASVHVGSICACSKSLAQVRTDALLKNE